MSQLIWSVQQLIKLAKQPKPGKRGVTHRRGARPGMYYVLQRQYVRECLNTKWELQELAWRI